MSGYTSSSEEDIERFKEAIDRNFLKENLFKKSEKESEPKKQNEGLPSLRNKFQSNVIINNPFTIKVTPSYQLHVSKYLTKILEKTIDDVEIIPLKKKKRKKSNVGIKLLSTSKNYLVIDTNFRNDDTKSCTSFNEIDSGDSDIERKAKEVAVSADWVLSQAEIKHWVPCTKGEIEII